MLLVLELLILPQEISWRLLREDFLNDQQSERLLGQNHGLLHREFLQTTEDRDCEEFDWSFPYRKARKALVLKDQ